MVRLVWLGLLLFLAANSIGQVPRITSISKTKGTSNTIVEIQGANFGNDPNLLKVSFGAALANIISASDNIITVTVPSGTTYSNITVTNVAIGISGSFQPILLSYGGEGVEATTFGNPATYSTNPGLTEHCLCDLDNNGTTDIVTSTSDAVNNALTVLKNGSTPSSFLLTKSDVVTNSATLSLACEDLDGDGRKDIVAAKSGGVGDQIFVLKNTSTPTTISFAASVPFFTNSDFIRKVLIKDLDGDGRPDIIANSESDNLISIFKNTSTPGNINFSSTPVEITVAGTVGTTTLFSEDLNNDGYPEIIANSFLGQNILLLKNKSTASGIAFENMPSLAVQSGANQLLNADINLDGKTDIAVTNLNTGVVSILINATESNGSSFNFREPVNVMAHINAWGVDAGDVDGDGKVDLVVGSTDNNKVITILRNISESAADLKFENIGIPSTEKSKSIKIGDLDDDGKPDISYTGIDNSKVIVLKNKGCINPKIIANNALSFCKSSSLRLELPWGNGAIYKWFKDDVEIPANTNNYLDVLGSGVYHASIVEANSTCSSLSTPQVVRVIEPDSPVPQFNIISDGKTAFCEDDSLILEVEGSFLEYRWSSGETTKFIKIKEGGLYSVEAKAGGGCIVRNQITIERNPLPLVKIDGDKTTITKGESVQLTTTGADTYLWSAAEGISDPTVANQVVSPQQTTSYQVTGQNSTGCTQTATITIVVEEINFEVTPHSIFSPNNDGIHDLWEIDNIINFPDCKVTIFNRSGAKLFEASPYVNNWDGTNNGKNLPHGDYYYVIKDPKTNNQKTGSFLLVR